MPSPPFVDPESGGLDLGQIRSEAFPVAGLVVLFGALALLPFLLTLFIRYNRLLVGFFTLVSQFIIAVGVGVGVVLMYVVARGIQLADG